MDELLQVSLTLHDCTPSEAGAIVDAGLEAANQAAAPLQEVRPLSCFARLASGVLIGGAVGRTWGSCCELQQLWVDPAFRRRGIGARLVREFERGGKERGCRTFYLETFSFQAPALYLALGYGVALEIDGYSPGVCKYTMIRRDPGAAS
jgi:ribosomal protein S18 acetylase RimI-like enzyme